MCTPDLERDGTNSHFRSSKMSLDCKWWDLRWSQNDQRHESFIAAVLICGYQTSVYLSSCYMQLCDLLMWIVGESECQCEHGPSECERELGDVCYSSGWGPSKWARMNSFDRYKWASSGIKTLIYKILSAPPSFTSPEDQILGSNHHPWASFSRRSKHLSEHFVRFQWNEIDLLEGCLHSLTKASPPSKTACVYFLIYLSSDIDKCSREIKASVTSWFVFHQDTSVQNILNVGRCLLLRTGKIKLRYTVAPAESQWRVRNRLPRRHKAKK